MAFLNFPNSAADNKAGFIFEVSLPPAAEVIDIDTDFDFDIDVDVDWLMMTDFDFDDVNDVSSSVVSLNTMLGFLVNCGGGPLPLVLDFEFKFAVDIDSTLPRAQQRFKVTSEFCFPRNKELT